MGEQEEHNEMRKRLAEANGQSYHAGINADGEVANISVEQNNNQQNAEEEFKMNSGREPSREPSLCDMTLKEFELESERQRTEGLNLRKTPSRLGGLAKKALAIGALVAASMYVGAKYSSPILSIENNVRNYFSSQYNQDNLTYQK